MNNLKKLNGLSICYNIVKRCVRTSSALNSRVGGESRKEMMRSMPARDEGVIGERRSELDSSGYEKIVDFPDMDTPNRIFDGKPFKDHNILYIKAGKNNTLFLLADSDGKKIFQRSCYSEGFKNARKGTNIAAQVTALGMARHILNAGVKSVRACIYGLGPGRAVSIRSIKAGGVNIISITDISPIAEYPDARPKKARRV